MMSSENEKIFNLKKEEKIVGPHILEAGKKIVWYLFHDKLVNQ